MGVIKMKNSLILLHFTRNFASNVYKPLPMIKPPVPVFGVEGRYATALFSAASKEKKLDIVEKDVNNLRALLKTDKKLAEFVLNPIIKRALKKDVLEKALIKAKYNPLTVNLIGALLFNGRLKNLNSIMDCFSGIMSTMRGEIVCKIISAKPLEPALMKEFEDTLKGFVKKTEKIMLETKVDPTLIGGVIISIGDKYIDMSLATKIKTYDSLLREVV